MALLFFKTKNFIPDFYYSNFSEIDFKFFLDMGKSIIFLDIDNTIMTYSEKVPIKSILDNINKAIELGFDIILVSNNSKKRVSEFANKMNFKYIARANKPFKKGYKKAIKLINNQSKEKVIFIGDQLITDIFGANKMEITNLLVNPLKTKTEHWYTKINRCLENSVLKSMRKIDESMYKKIKKGRSNEK